MKYIKINCLNLPTIPEKYTFFLEVENDNSFTYGVGISTEEIIKYGTKSHDALWEWLENKEYKFSNEEVEKYKISRDEFEVARQKAVLSKRKNLK